MPRCAIYARFSSDRQSVTSADDQARLCRRRAEAEGWDVVEVYADLAISGANNRRPYMTAMLQAAEAGAFDIVLTEDLDRLARNQGDIASLHQRLEYCDVRIFTLANGWVDELQIGFKGTMDALELKKIAAKTRRGARAALERGRVPGGLSYGYALAPRVHADGHVEVGLRRIVPEQAAVIRRIFEEYISGRGPRAIARGLNADRIPSPRGGDWRAPAIIGSSARLSGILANPVYVGRVVWNRARWKRHPDTRNRLSQLNPREDRVEISMPELRIIDDAIWTAAQELRQSLAAVPAARRLRPRHFLSCLVKCGECAGNYTVIDRGRWGCSRHRDAGTCGNGQRIAGEELERRVLGGLKQQLLSADAVAMFEREYRKASAAIGRQNAGLCREAERHFAAADAAVTRLVEAIADGGGAFKELRVKLQEQVARRDEARAALGELEAAPVVALHPGLAEAYRRRIQALAENLKGREVTSETSAGQVRALIERVTIKPADNGRADIEVTSSLAAALSLASNEHPGRGAFRGSVVVAGTGFEPVTFRL